MLSYLILGTIFGFSFVFLLIYFHKKTIWKHRKLLFWLNFLGTIYWYVADYVGYSSKFWDVSRSKSIGIWVGPVSIEDIIFGLVGTFVIPIIVILMKEAYSSGSSIRKIFFKKE